jgi:cytosine/adenosine deaminase-related metal-dependent hydrolase
MHKHCVPLVLLFAACAHQQAPLRYTVLMSTNKAGSEVVSTRGAEVTADYEFNDRGRGPKTHTVMQLDARGVPVSMLTTGNDYLKQQIEERFSIDNGTARWKNTAETSEGKAGAFYASMYGPPEKSAVLARALLKAGGKLALLPAGEATIRKVDERNVRGTRVAAYEIGGLGFSPFELWLDDHLQLFGSVSSWSSVIREGFESETKALIDAQDARASARIATLAKTYTHHPAGNRITVINARIFDPRSGTLSAPTTINVEGNRIASVGVPEERNAAELIDAGGRVVLPGLWDMHVHIGDVDGLLNVAAGITSVRDLGNDSDFLLAYKQKIEAGESIGPRIVMAGLVDGRGPFQGPTNMLADNEDEARKVIDFFVAHGYEGLKIYSSVKPELVPFMAKYAHEHGLRVSGHIPAGMRASEAVDAGYDEIQHANMLFLNFMPDVKDTRTPQRFTAVAERGADLDLASAEVRAFIEQLKAHHTVLDPTLTVFEGMFTARTGTMSPSYAMMADRFPPQVRRYFLTGGLPVTPENDARYRQSFARMLELVRTLHDSGLRIVAGTDGMAGFTLQRELELYAQAGIPPAEVLRMATLQPAEILKRDHDLGTIEPGKLADFILVDGDPTRNISDIRRVVTVVKDGVVFVPAELYGELGVLSPKPQP